MKTKIYTQDDYNTLDELIKAVDEEYGISFE